MPVRSLRKLVLSLAVIGLLLIAAGWPLAARHREHRLHGFSFSGCGLGKIGVRAVPVDDNPEHDLLPHYTSYPCEVGNVTVWGKVE